MTQKTRYYKGNFRIHRSNLKQYDSTTFFAPGIPFDEFEPFIISVKTEIKNMSEPVDSLDVGERLYRYIQLSKAAKNYPCYFRSHQPFLKLYELTASSIKDIPRLNKSIEARLRKSYKKTRMFLSSINRLLETSLGK